MTTTAESATVTAQERSQSRLEQTHAMNQTHPMNDDTTTPEGQKPARSLPGRPPGIRADSSGLTDRQRRVIEVIRDSVQRRGYPPSMREIGQAVGLSSTSSVAHQLMALERKGFLRRDPHRPRAYEVRGSDQPSTQPRTPPASPPPPMCRWSAGSRPVARSSPRSRSRMSSRSPGSWSATVSSSC
ncbi:hypothetical protein SVIO_078010 [Streptomyces violaceusniger]|uniref:LexA repressor DNA-binding domain-containing protein n=1 Tax=Streptomyces violaceusniger TaxID=68280 RepID=A0A4D4LF83_STRVO|nr:hypothetical protein SVIO_078010 [Streptomyces violaceusniger]